MVFPTVWIFLDALKVHVQSAIMQSKLSNLSAVFRTNCESHNLIREVAGSVGGTPVRQ